MRDAMIPPSLRSLVLLPLLVLGSTVDSRGAVLVVYEMDNLPGAGGTSSLDPTQTVSDVTASTLVRGPAFVNGTLGNPFGTATSGSLSNNLSGTVTNGVGTGTVATGTAAETYLAVSTRSTGVNEDQYFKFTLTTSAGVDLNLETISLDVSRGGTSNPRGVQLRYSFDGLAFATIGSYSRSSGASAQFSNVTFTLPDEFALGELTTASSVEFRLFVFSDTNQSVLFDNITINGLVIPEPSTTTLFGLAALGLVASRRKRVALHAGV